MNSVTCRRQQVLILTSCFMVLCLTGYFVPYVHDDWAWGGSLGLERLANFFQDYNGRYLGNLLVIAGTHSRLFKALLTGLTGTVIIAAVGLPGHSQPFHLLLSAFLLFSMPRQLLRQSFAWLSALTNYVVPLCLFLPYLAVCRELFFPTKAQTQMQTRTQALTALLWAPVGFASCLCIEHATVAFTAAALFLFAAERRVLRTRRSCAVTGGYLGGALAGAVVMFLNPAYRVQLTTQKGYGHVEQSGGLLRSALESYVRYFSGYLFLNNLMLNLVLLLGMLLLIRQCRHASAGILRRLALLFCLTLMAGSAALSGFICLRRIFFDISYPSDVANALITTAFLAAVCLFDAAAPIDRGLRIRLLFLTGVTAVMIGPLLILRPIACRCFVPAYFLMCAYALEIFREISPEMRCRPHTATVCTTTAATAAGAAAALWLWIYGGLYVADRDRLESIRAQIAEGAVTVTVPYFYNDVYLWRANPVKTEKINWERRYKKFYGLPENITIVLTDEERAHDSLFLLTEPRTPQDKDFPPPHR